VIVEFNTSKYSAGAVVHFVKRELITACTAENVGC